MRVIQLNSVCGAGSTGRIAVSLHDALAASGADSWIAYGRGRSTVAKARRFGSTADFVSHAIRTRVLDEHGLGSGSATRALVDWLDDAGPDVVHLHNIHGYYLHFELLFSFLRRSRARVLWTLHDCWSFTGHCAYYDHADCAKWQSHCERCPQRGSYPASWARDASSRMFDRKRAAFTSLERLELVTPSRWLATQLATSFLAHYPVHVVPNGIDISTFAPRTSDIRSRLRIPVDAAIVLGVAASFAEPRKGVQFLLELAATHPRAVVVLVGFPKGQAHNLPPNVIALPRTDNLSTLVDLYSAADVFVNPTLEDNFPTVGIEALACGTPVVTFNTGGCAEQITDETGITVPRGDRRALTHAVDMVLEAGRAHFAERCRRRAAEFTIDRMVQAYLRLYDGKATTGETRQGRGRSA